MLLAGLRQHHTFAGAVESIAAQWEAFRRLGPIPHQQGGTVYGVMCGADMENQTFEYMMGVEVAEFDSAATHLGRMRIPPQHYAVFPHAGHVSTLAATWQAIWNEWLPRSGHVPVHGPEFEVYGEGFDPRTGAGGIEVWTAIQPPALTPFPRASTDMAADPITITRAALTDDVSRALIGQLNAELTGMYPEPGATHFGLDPEEVAPGRGAFLVVYQDGTPVGCGALRRIDAETGELKRMYVSPAVRGTGLGRRLVAALEAEARALGVRRLVLETGTRQHAAIALYRATGFTPIPLYGEYLRSPDTSVCLGKELAGQEG